MNISDILNRLDELEVVGEDERNHLDVWSWSLQDAVIQLWSKGYKPDMVVGTPKAVSRIVGEHLHGISGPAYQNTVSEHERLANDGGIIATYTVLKLIRPQVLKVIFVPADVEDLHVIDSKKGKAVVIKTIPLSFPELNTEVRVPSEKKSLWKRIWGYLFSAVPIGG